MATAVDPSPDPGTVHWAYLVGGSADVFRDMRRHLMKAGVNIAGHSKMEGKASDVSIPRSATVVLCATDGSNHSAVDAARAEARKRGIPCVLAPFRHWSLCSLRLTEAGITGGNHSIFTGADSSVRKFQAILESTPTVGAALMRREVEKPTTEITVALRDEILEEHPELAPAFGAQPEPPPPQSPAALPPANDPRPPEPEPVIPHQDITPTFTGRDLVRQMIRSPSEAARRRQDLARKLIREAKGEIKNREVREAVLKKCGKGIHHDLINHLRVELGFKPHGRGGREMAELSPAMKARLHIPADPGSPPQNLGSEAPKAPPPTPPAPPPAPVRASPLPPAQLPPRKPARRAMKRDPLALIAELQEELRARGIWGVMIEASGTFTFQQGR